MRASAGCSLVQALSLFGNTGAMSGNFTGSGAGHIFLLLTPFLKLINQLFENFKFISTKPDNNACKFIF
jgi:hypothetical protein